ncbi:MAG TPA: efflux RND transporter periplasmic adaptor subunit [Thermodesulfobacteriota bacterium]|nr:efflux RND transporter periplasmic adaptor subunit [Thermodesulfobacteriota bacterium]
MTTDPTNRTVDLSSLRIDRDKPQSRRRFLKLSAGVLILLLVLFLFFRVAPRHFAFLSPEVSVARAILVPPSQAATVLTASGYIVARSKAEISPKTVGRIAWINLEEGQRVKKGELVARLENQELIAQKAEASANLANARRELVRQKELFAKGITTEQSLDNAETQVEIFEAQLHYIEEQIRNTEIYAPIDGVVTVKKAFLGETVTPQGFGAGSAGATFAVIVDLDSLEMEADINEQNVSKLRLGMPAEVTLDAYPDRSYKARLRQIVPTADRQKGSVKVKIELLERDERVLPEMSCRVYFQNWEILSEGKSRVMIPVSSVIDMDGEKGVFLLNRDAIRFQPVALGNTVGSQIEVMEGLSGGEEIVVEAADNNLENGQKVRRKSE